MLLIPDSNNKLLSKFQGPCVISDKLNDYAYMVKMPDNSVRRLHANKIRKFVVRSVQSVIREDEGDIGDIEFHPSSSDPPSSEDAFGDLNLSHLDSTQQQELRGILVQFKHVFNDKHGRCNVSEHVIELDSEYVPKRKPPYLKHSNRK